jgi:nucleoside-diphosphate-sugar epimerase
MRILITGRSGFIGSSLGPALEARGHDLRNEGVEGCDAMVHLANIAHARVDRRLLWKVNVEGTLGAAEAAAKAGVRRFLYLSSVKARESDDEYGSAKLAAERALQGLKSQMEIVILRPPLVYGPRVRANFLALMRAIARGWPLPLASIQNRRSLVYVGNLCDAVAACLERVGAAGKTFYVTDGEAVSTPALCRAIGDALGRPARLFRFPPRFLPLDKLKDSLVVDDAPLRAELGWKPPFSLAEGLSATAAWYRNR